VLGTACDEAVLAFHQAEYDKMTPIKELISRDLE